MKRTCRKGHEYELRRAHGCPECVHAWFRVRPDWSRNHKHRRRSRKRGNGVETVRVKDLASLLRFQEGRCVYCREPLPGTRHLDHVTPLSRGGAHALSNLAWACPACNMAKGSKTLAEFRKPL